MSTLILCLIHTLGQKCETSRWWKHHLDVSGKLRRATVTANTVKMTNCFGPCSAHSKSGTIFSCCSLCLFRHVVTFLRESTVSGSYPSFQRGKHGSHTHMRHLSIYMLNVRKVEKKNKQKSELKHGNVHIYLDVPGMPVECVKTHPRKDNPFSFCQICCRTAGEPATALHI